MPYLKISSKELPLDQKRLLAKEITDVYARVRRMSPEERQTCTLHFVPLEPQNVAIGGRLIADGAEANYHLVISDHDLGSEDKKLLVKELTPLMLRVFGLSKDSLNRVTIFFAEQRADDLAIGGQFYWSGERAA